MTLTARVTLAAVAAVVACAAVIAWTVYALEERSLRERIDDNLTAYAASLGSQLLSTGDADEAIRSGPLDASPYYAQVVLADGEVVPLSSTRALLPVDRRTSELAGGSGDRFFADVEIDGSHVRVLAVPTPDGAIQVASEVEDADLQMLQLTGVILLAGAVGATLALVVGMLVARFSLRPVRQLAQDAEDIAGSHDFSARLPVRGTDELSRLATSLNSLLDALDESLRTQRQLVADASHELKTPLTGLRTELELAGRNGTAADATQLRDAVDDLVSAVDDLVELARDHPTTETADDVALEQLALECVRWTRRHHPEARITTSLDPHEVRCVRSQVARAIDNLLDNALKHAPGASEVEVRLRAGVLSVRDHGPGIAEEDLPYVFERFYRSADARRLPGAGLGLAIVQKVAREHGWTVRADNASGGGAVISLDTEPGRTTSPDAPLSRERTPDSDARPGRRGRVSVGLAVVAGSIAGAGALVGVPALAGQRGGDLEATRGVLSRCGAELCVGGRPVAFGTERAHRSTTSQHDLDGDGAAEDVVDELEGLIGTWVLVEASTDDAGHVHAVNGMTYTRPEESPSTDPDQGGRTAGARGDEVEIEQLSGRLERCGIGYCVSGQVVDFGPQWWLQRTRAPEDLDHDGSVETFAEELEGRIATDLTVRVESGGGDVADVHSIDGLVYRRGGGPPPWADGPTSSERSVGAG